MTGEKSARDWRRVSWTLIVLGVGVLFAVLSFFLAEWQQAWWSNLLANAAIVILLLVPGEWVLSRLTRQIVQVDSKVDRVEVKADDAQTSADHAQQSAEAAQATAEQSVRSLSDLRETLLEKQGEELEEEIGWYQSLVSAPTRENLISVLMKATTEGLITSRGVRSPIWETYLHYRYVVSADQLVVQIEKDDQTVLSVIPWEVGVEPEDFFALLVHGVRDNGADLGTRLNDPTESLERLSEMLVRLIKLRSQALLGYRGSLTDVIEYADGWFYTEKLMVAPDRHGYEVAVARLDELDWEKHLHQKGWDDGVSAIEFGRRLYGYPRPSRFDAPSATASS